MFFFTCNRARLLCDFLIKCEYEYTSIVCIVLYVCMYVRTDRQTDNIIMPIADHTVRSTLGYINK